MTTTHWMDKTNPTQFEDVIFLQGDAAIEALNLAEHDEMAALQHLAQWHEPGKHRVLPEADVQVGSSDTVVKHNGYVMSYNPRIGYIGLVSALKSPE